MLQETFGYTDGFTRIWSYTGDLSRAQGWADELSLEDPILADDDGSLRRDYFIPNGDDAFAANPRHFIIDAEGTLTFVQTTVAPEALETAIRDALGE